MVSYSGDIIAVYASGGRSTLNTLTFLRRVLSTCEGKPVIVEDIAAGIALIHNILLKTQEGGVIPS